MENVEEDNKSKEVFTNYGVEMDLLLAADVGDLPLCKKLIEEDGVDPSNKFNHPKFNHHSPPLVYASRSGHLPVIKYLVEKGANINGVDVEDWSSLYYAAYNGHFQICQFLLQCGANPDLKDNFKHRTALDVAKYRQFKAVVNLIANQNVPFESYERDPESIRKDGNKKVMKGVHWKNKDLFLGRYSIDKETVLKLQEFRKKSTNPDIVYNATDTVVGINVVVRHTHSFAKHYQKIEECFNQELRFIRASSISTNESYYNFFRFKCTRIRLVI